MRKIKLPIAFKLWVLAVFGLVAYQLVYKGITVVDTSSIETLNGGEILCIGHGGNGIESVLPFQYLPTNSLGAIQKALDKGADGIELDVQMTKDSVLVLYHDNKLEERTTGKGCIGNLLWSEIEGAEYTIGGPYDWLQNEKIIRLTTALDLLKDRASIPYIYLDYHGLNHCTAPLFDEVPIFCRSLDRLLLEKQLPGEKIGLISIYPVVLQAFKAMEFKSIIFLEETVSFEAAMETCKELGIRHIEAKVDILTVENVKAAHAQGIFVMTHGGKSRWGISERAALHVDAIQADAVELLIDMLK